MVTKRPCYLNALGMINCLGSEKEDIKARILTGDGHLMHPVEDPVLGKKVLVARVREPLPPIPSKHVRHNCRNNQLLLAAYMQIVDAVDGQIRRFGRHRVGIVLGSSTSGIAAGEEALEEKSRSGSFPPAFHFLQQEIGAVAEFLADVSGVTGPAYTISTACSSSANVFASSRRLLEIGLCDAVIVGGADSLCKLTLNGFSALEAISEGVCNPMSKNRDGINIGEGAALFLMTKEGSGVELFGVGQSSDAYHISSPDPEGKGAEAAMRHALQDVGVKAADIVYINLHGTATLQNDAMEATAIHRVFGKDVPCSSTKPLTGHTLGAAGAMELGFCWLILSEMTKQFALPPHRWDGKRDENLPEIHLVQQGEHVAARDITMFLSNSFAFGGSNCAVIIGVRRKNTAGS